jgi:hypothetical protein
MSHNEALETAKQRYRENFTKDERGRHVRSV